jgi:hypothetical protein
VALGDWSRTVTYPADESMQAVQAVVTAVNFARSAAVVPRSVGFFVQPLSASVPAALRKHPVRPLLSVLPSQPEELLVEVELTLEAEVDDDALLELLLDDDEDPAEVPAERDVDVVDPAVVDEEFTMMMIVVAIAMTATIAAIRMVCSFRAREPSGLPLTGPTAGPKVPVPGPPGPC